MPTTVPMATRIAGVMRLLSNEYFTRKTIPRKSTNPPIQAKSFTPKNASQSNGLAGGGGTNGGGGGGDGGGGGAPRGRAGNGDGGCFISVGAAAAAFGIGGGTGAAAFDSAIGSAAATGTRSPRVSNSPTRFTRLRTALFNFCS